MSPNPTSMTIPARTDNTTAAKQVVTFFFLENNPTRPPFERPALQKQTRVSEFVEANVRSKSGTLNVRSSKAGRSMSGRDRVRAYGGGKFAIGCKKKRGNTKQFDTAIPKSWRSRLRTHTHIT